MNKTHGVSASGAAWRPHGRCSGQGANVKKCGLAKMKGNPAGFPETLKSEQNRITAAWRRQRRRGPPRVPRGWSEHPTRFRRYSAASGFRSPVHAPAAPGHAGSGRSLTSENGRAGSLTDGRRRSARGRRTDIGRLIIDWLSTLDTGRMGTGQVGTGQVGTGPAAGDGCPHLPGDASPPGRTSAHEHAWSLLGVVLPKNAPGGQTEASSSRLLRCNAADRSL